MSTSSILVVTLAGLVDPDITAQALQDLIKGALYAQYIRLPKDREAQAP